MFRVSIKNRNCNFLAYVTIVVKIMDLTNSCIFQFLINAISIKKNVSYNIKFVFNKQINFIFVFLRTLKLYLLQYILFYKILKFIKVFTNIFADYYATN